MVDLSGSGYITTPYTDTDNGDLIGVNVIKFLEVVNDTPDVANALRGVFEEVRLAAALALVGGIVADSHKTFLGKLLYVKGYSLLLNTTSRVHNNKS